jgi:prophage DNA circulation protein
MPFSLLNLQQASFKGAVFLIDDAELESGRKTATFEYPNQNTRFVEDLGLFPPIIEITGIISGENYVADRDALINALSSAGPGILVHPFYGAITVTLNKYFKLSERPSELGIAKFKMTFATTSAIPQPSLSNNNLPAIGDLSNRLNDASLSDFENLYNQIYKAQENFNDALNKMNSLFTTLNRITFGAIDLDGLNDFNADLRENQADVTHWITDGTTLGMQTQDILNSANSVSSSPEDSINANSQLFGFGSDDTLIVVGDSAVKQERLDNRTAINDLVNITTLSNSYANAVQVNYTDSQQLDSVQQTLESQYQTVINSPNISSTTTQLLEDLRAQVTIFFQNTGRAVTQIIPIQTETIPLLVLTYNYYASLDNLNDLSALNQLYNPAMTSGEINIFTG